MGVYLTGKGSLVLTMIVFGGVKDQETIATVAWRGSPDLWNLVKAKRKEMEEKIVLLQEDLTKKAAVLTRSEGVWNVDAEGLRTEKAELHLEVENLNNEISFSVWENCLWMRLRDRWEAYEFDRGRVKKVVTVEESSWD